MISHSLPSIPHPIGMHDTVSGCLTPEQALQVFSRIIQDTDEEPCTPPEPIRSILNLIDASVTDEEHRHHPDLL